MKNNDEKVTENTSLWWKWGRIIVYTITFTVIMLLWNINFRSQKTQFTDQPTRRTDALLVLLPEYFVASQKAFCLDGSPPGYYIRYSPSLSNHKWIIHLAGGAWCENSKNCKKRSESNLGSTVHANKVKTLKGILSPDANLNPDFFDWNVVEFIYCDGSSFLGNLSEPVIYDGKTLYMRGAVIFEVMVNYLLEHTSLSVAHQVLLTGSSAGSLGALMSVDKFKEKLPDTDVKAVVDAGLFLDLTNINGKHTMSSRLKGVFNFHNMRDSVVLRKCTNLREDNNKWRCFLPGVFYHYVKTPTYYINTYHDSWYGRKMMGVRCWFNKLNCSAKEENVANKIHQSLNNISLEILKNGNDGIYLTTCKSHMIMVNEGFFRVLSYGITPAKGLHLWLNNDAKGRNITGYHQQCLQIKGSLYGNNSVGIKVV